MVGRPKKYDFAIKHNLKTVEGRRAYAKEYQCIVGRFRKKERYHTDETFRRKIIDRSIEDQRKRRHQLKKELFLSLGNKCKICDELEECCLIIHHIDESMKPLRGSKSIDITGIRKYRNHFKQLDNLMLLCANCHRKLHAGLIT